LADPALLDFRPITPDGRAFTVSGFRRDGMRRFYPELLSASEDVSPRKPVLLKGFPSDPKLLQSDVGKIARKVIERHGLEEWKAVFLTNELHRHLGIYSILGAKMGIRARELLRASVDELQVESHAGVKPPLSCMNDGLQVATGASLGRGTIRVEARPGRPGAVFRHDDVILRLALKRAVGARIRADIRHTVSRFGKLTPEYFKQIRRLSLTYWYEMDRTKIFEESTDQAEGSSHPHGAADHDH
jgi:pyrimidine-specific ribonucleoside hydrolase